LTGRRPNEVAEAVLALADEGLVAPGPAARSGSPAGRVRLRD